MQHGYLHVLSLGWSRVQSFMLARIKTELFLILSRQVTLSPEVLRFHPYVFIYLFTYIYISLDMHPFIWISILHLCSTNLISVVQKKKGNIVDSVIWKTVGGPLAWRVLWRSRSGAPQSPEAHLSEQALWGAVVLSHHLQCKQSAFGKFLYGSKSFCMFGHVSGNLKMRIILKKDWKDGKTGGNKDLQY